MTGAPAIPAPAGESGVARFHADPGQFARAVGVQGAQLMWLVGAGASQASGIPTAAGLIIQFKHQLYCDANELGIQDVSYEDPRTRSRIEAFFDGQNGFPPHGDPSEYSLAFERVYESPDVRAAFIATLCRGRRPNFGHYVMGALMATDRLRVVFTTNFDDLIEAGARSLFELAGVDPRPTLVSADLEDANKAIVAMQRDTWPLVASLHGDFRSVQLKNTATELSKQDVKMRTVLRGACRRFGLVVVGYSGRDTSVMAVLHEALDDPESFGSGIYWVYRPDVAPSAEVQAFLSAAQDRGRTVAAVPVGNFVELGGMLQRAISFPVHVRDVLESHRSGPIAQDTPLPIGPTSPYPILRLNAVTVDSLPTHVRVLHERARIELTEAQRALRTAHVRGLIARRSGGQLVAAGTDAELRAVLGPLGLDVRDETVQLEWDGDALPDPADHGLVMDALTIGLGRTQGLRHVLTARGHQVRVLDPDAPNLHALRSACGTLTGTVHNTTVQWAEAAGLTLERRNKDWWLLASPEIWIAPGTVANQPEDERARLAQRAVVSDFVRERRARRYNAQANDILDAWVRILCGGNGTRDVRTWNLTPGAGVDPIFGLVGATAYARRLVKIESSTSESH